MAFLPTTYMRCFGPCSDKDYVNLPTGLSVVDGALRIHRCDFVEGAYTDDNPAYCESPTIKEYNIVAIAVVNDAAMTQDDSVTFTVTITPDCDFSGVIYFGNDI